MISHTVRQSDSGPAHTPVWRLWGMSRRDFLRSSGLAAGALTFSPFAAARWNSVFAQGNRASVALVKNGDCFQNTAKAVDLAGGIQSFVGQGDTVIIKGNAQWRYQGYTHTGCIKGVADAVLGIPGYSGEIFICDNVQFAGYNHGFISTDRYHNWPDHNWNSLASAYQAQGKPVAAVEWKNTDTDIAGPAGITGDIGWIREYFAYSGLNAYYSYPIFRSPLSSGRLIDPSNGVWANGAYTGARVRTIFVPTLNNHGEGSEDYSGVTSAIKCFMGATEINGPFNTTWYHNGAERYTWHSTAFHDSVGKGAQALGAFASRYMNTMYAPALFVTAAMWSGHQSRTGGATETKTVLACTNPATLDYVSCKHVISPYAAWLNPDNDNNTRRQILGCVDAGTGTITPGEYEVLEFDFNRPTVTRIDVERKIRDHKSGIASEQEVKNTIRAYLEQ